MTADLYAVIMTVLEIDVGNRRRGLIVSKWEWTEESYPSWIALLMMNDDGRATKNLVSIRRLSRFVTHHIKSDRLRRHIALA